MSLSLSTLPFVAPLTTSNFCHQTPSMIDPQILQGPRIVGGVPVGNVASFSVPTPLFPATLNFNPQQF